MGRQDRSDVRIEEPKSLVSFNETRFFIVFSVLRRVHPRPGRPRLRRFRRRGVADTVEPHQAGVRRGLQERDGGDQAARPGL